MKTTIPCHSPNFIGVSLSVIRVTILIEFKLFVTLINTRSFLFYKLKCSSLARQTAKLVYKAALTMLCTFCLKAINEAIMMYYLLKKTPNID